jgi:hypothetical protein
MVFPTGQLSSRRWRPVAWALLTVGGLLFAALVLTPGLLLNGVPASENPLGAAALHCWSASAAPQIKSGGKGQQAS